MPRPCTVCLHPQLAAIDKALVAGTPSTTLAAVHGLSNDAISRHRLAHLPATLALARRATEEGRADELLFEVERLTAKARQLGQQAEEGGDLRVALLALKEQRGCVELVSKLFGDQRKRAIEDGRYVSVQDVNELNDVWQQLLNRYVPDAARESLAQDMQNAFGFPKESELQPLLEEPSNEQ